MGVEELKQIIEKSENKFSVFENIDLLLNYNFTVNDFIDLINTYLNDEQKINLFKLEYLKKLENYIPEGFLFNGDKKNNFSDEVLKYIAVGRKYEIINSIGDRKLRVQIYNEADVISELMPPFDSQVFLNEFNEDERMEFIRGDKIQNIRAVSKFNVINSLSDKNKKSVLSDYTYLKEILNLDEGAIVRLIEGFEDEKLKLKMINKYYEIPETLLRNLNTDSIDHLLASTKSFNNYDLIGTISLLNVDSIIEFINKEKDYLKEKKIKPYQIVKNLEDQLQLEIVDKLEQLDLVAAEETQILATLSNEVKEKVDKTNFSGIDREALNIQISSNPESKGKIPVDFNQDSNIYKGLDEELYINAMHLSETEKTKLLELCNICPKLQMSDDLLFGKSTVEEYKNAENWIQNVVQQINPKWNMLQKIAFIDNSIGKRISYSPDYLTEACDEFNARALWKIIDSGYGVCNGIALVEKYILDKVGIESEMVESDTHVFLKIKNLKYENNEGELIQGDTILDPTWNLMAHRYGAKPENFCISYEEIRKYDINNDGIDFECHKNDEELSEITLNIDENTLKNVFSSIGVADQNGNFPIKALVDKSNEIDNLELSDEESIREQLRLLEEYYSDFSECQNSTMEILSTIILNHENLNFDRCVVSRVYNKDDEEMRPILYVFVQLEDGKKIFYFADKENKRFEELTQEKFEERFECYDTDMDEYEGYRPWDDNVNIEITKDLNTSSGTVTIQEGEEK